MPDEGKMLKVSADSKLWTRFTSLGEEVTGLREIVQNDVEIPADAYIRWRRSADALRVEIGRIMQDVADHIFKKPPVPAARGNHRRRG